MNINEPDNITMHKHIIQNINDPGRLIGHINAPGNIIEHIMNLAIQLSI